MSGHDATFATEGKRKWSHSSPTRSWKEMGNSEGKHWSVFCYVIVDGEAVWMLLITAFTPPVSIPDPIPVALTKACAGCCRYGQLWTDGWHRAGQYVLPDGVLQEIWRAALWQTQFRFSKCSQEIWQDAMCVSTGHGRFKPNEKVQLINTITILSVFRIILQVMVKKKVFHYIYSPTHEIIFMAVYVQSII